MKRRMRLWLTLLGVLLVAAALWSHGQLARQRAAAVEALAQAAECQDMAARIERAGQRPTLSGDPERLAAEVVGRVEQAARQASIPAGSLLRISPEPPRRVGESAYKERPTLVLLREVSRRQLVQFLHGLEADQSGLRTQAIRLAAPREDDARDLWHADVTLTYLIYEPAPAGNAGARP